MLGTIGGGRYLERRFVARARLPASVVVSGRPVVNLQSEFVCFPEAKREKS